jgi:putative NADH-flavin reductase
VILGATGAAGRAVAAEFADAGWEVVGTGRDPQWFPADLQERGVSFISGDRHDPDALQGVLADGADLVVDCVCYCAQHARALLKHRQEIRSVVMLSSKAVYVDQHGHHSNSDSQPRFAGPVSEHQPVLEPDFSGAYASRQG